MVKEIYSSNRARSSGETPRRSSDSKLELADPSEHVYRTVSEFSSLTGELGDMAKEARRRLGLLRGKSRQYPIPPNPKGEGRDEAVLVLYHDVVDHVITRGERFSLRY